MLDRQFIAKLDHAPGETAAQTFLRQLDLIVSEHNKNTGASLNALEALSLALNCKPTEK